jgi:EmrB/QacA subfamily drug resistance transporter
MLEFRVFKHSIFTVTTTVNAVVTMAMFAAMILLPIYLQTIRGFTPLQSGLLLLPGAILMGIMSPITGALYDRIGARPLAIIGLLITAITTYEFSNLTDATTYGFIMVLYSARMFGMSMLMMPVMTEGLNSLPRHLNSHGTAMFNTMRQVAGSLGTAFLVTVMTSRTTFHLANYQNSMTTSNTNLTNQLNGLGQAAGNYMHLPQGQGQQLVSSMLFGKAAMESMIKGINDAFLVATLLAVIALFLSFFIKRSVPSKKKVTRRSRSSRKASEAAAE